ANESFHRNFSGLTTSCRTRSGVLSVEPLSTLMTSLTIDLTLWAAPAIQSCSFLTIMQSQLPIRRGGKGKCITKWVLSRELRRLCGAAQFAALFSKVRESPVRYRG